MNLESSASFYSWLDLGRHGSTENFCSFGVDFFQICMGKTNTKLKFLQIVLPFKIGTLGQHISQPFYI